MHKFLKRRGRGLSHSSSDQGSGGWNQMIVIMALSYCENSEFQRQGFCCLSKEIIHIIYD